MADSAVDGRILDQLFTVIAARRDADPSESYTAKLLVAGPEQVAKKLGEEATETVIAGVSGDAGALAAESADLLYHLMVLWAARGIEPGQVWRALDGRQGVSGLAEKASRGAS